MSQQSNEDDAADRSVHVPGSAIGGRVTAWDDWSSAPIGDEHRGLRVAASAIRAALTGLASKRGDCEQAEQLLAQLHSFRKQLWAHFDHEESTCASSSAWNHAGSPARQWLESVFADHVALRARINASVASLESCVAANEAPPESFDADVVACLDHLAQHELSEARIFQIAVLGH